MGKIEIKKVTIKMDVKIKFESIIESDVSDIASAALQGSIKFKKQLSIKQKKKSEITLDFTIVNKSAIDKRENLKVYQDLPKGIRVIAK